MDGEFTNAVRMAEWESAEGLRATYYVLHSASYYREHGDIAPDLRIALARIEGLGHDIGLHNDAVTVWKATGRKSTAVLERELADLRILHPINSTAAHGSAVCRRLGIVNYEVFTECFAGHPELEPVPMRSLGLDFEAYHVDHDTYVSDAGGVWKTYAHSQGAWTETQQLGDRIVVLMHPCHWGDMV